VNTSAEQSSNHPQPESLGSSLANNYQAIALERGIRPINGGEWLNVDGVETIWHEDTRERIPANNDPNVLSTRLDRVGRYDYNNGTLAFVDGEGHLRIGHGTSVNVNALEEAGYRRGGMFVPFSNGEVPTDPRIREHYTELRERGHELSKKEIKERHLKVYKDVAERKKIKPLNGGLWMMVDGIEYRRYSPEAERVDVNTDGYNMAIGRIDQVGTYDSNNGSLAYVDEQGRLWVGASTAENFAVLGNAGYHRGGIWVPFTNGEMPMDRSTYERLRDIRTGKPAEQLRAEREARVDEIIRFARELFGEAAFIPDRRIILERVADRQDYDYTGTDYIDPDSLVERQLHARIETDSGGFQRRIYSINGMTFAFRGREELPFYPTMGQSNTTVLGEEPNWESPEDYQTFKSWVKGLQKRGAPEHLLATKSLLGVVELAIRFGSKDQSLTSLRDELTKGIYSKRSINLLDTLVAASYINYGTSFNFEANQNAEALVLSALLGDPRSQVILLAKTEALKSLDRKERVALDQVKVEDESLRPQNLVCVHATKYEPKVGPGGEFIVPTTFDVTDGKVLRNSVHVALNHKVVSHMYGSWDNAGYVIVSPFESMVGANGVPTVLNTVDTWWTRDPGESLIFPDAVLVAPGGDNVDGLYQREGNIIRFKSEGLDRKELLALTNDARERESLDWFATRVRDAFFGPIHPWGEFGDQWNIDGLSGALNKFIYGSEDGFRGENVMLVNQILAGMEGENRVSLEDRIKQIFELSGADQEVSQKVIDREVAIDNLVQAMSGSIKDLIYGEINEAAVNDAIRSKGYKVQPGGQWAWGGSWGVTAQTHVVGEQIGSAVMAHTNSSQHLLTERFRYAVNDAFKDSEDGETTGFDWTKYNPKYDDLIGQVDPRTRRALYASGLLTSRVQSSKS